jgi:predicted transcriptional regulator
VPHAQPRRGIPGALTLSPGRAGRVFALAIAVMCAIGLAPTTAWAQRATTTTLSSSQNPSAVGQPVTFTATVTPTSGGGTPTGTVTFRDGATILGTGTLSGGQATFTTSSLSVGSHSITAAYGGNNPFNPSTSPVLIQTVGQAATSTALTSSQNPSALGQAVTFTATVTPTSGSGTPTGTVTFKDGATTLATVPLSGTTAAFTTSSLTVGSHSITATYNGDTNFASSTSPVLIQTVGQAATSTALTSSQNPSALGQAVTFTATVTPTSGSGTPTGTVTFKDGATTLATVPLSGTTAAFTTSSLTVGSHSITATYNGDTNFASSTSPVLIQTVGQAATSTALTSSQNPSALGQAVTFTATVTPTSGSGTPTGTVTFKDGATTLGTGTLNASGQASFTISSLSAGSHSITAVYGGDSNFTGSTSPALTQTVVGQAGTSTALSSSPNPSTFGQAVTFTATVTPTSGSATPTGTVTFADGATTLGTGTLSGGQATFTTSSLSAGNHTITATYGGDAGFTPSTSPALSQVVNQVPTTTALASSVNPSNVGQAVTFTATVSSGAGTPTGTVTFKDGATVIGTATLTAGAAAFTTSSLTLGTHTIIASYGGSAGFVASTSAALTQTVQIPPDSVRLRALQVAVTKVEAQSSGDAFAGAVASAIADGFAEGGALITPSGNSVRFNFAAEPDASLSGGRVVEQYDSVVAARASALRDSGPSVMNQNLPASVRNFAPDPSAASARVDDAFTALASAKPIVTKAPPLAPPAPKVWQLWADVRGTGWNTDPSAGDLRGGQINAIAGLTRKLTPDFLVGVLGGYENFGYSSQTLNGRLKGDGWTVGGYLGWRLWPAVRFDAAVGRSVVSYNGVSGTAAASFPGNRWLASAGFTGMYRTQRLEIEPSARVYAIWERDSSYIDSLGTLQVENTFSTGRASTGIKVAYPIYWDAAATVAPYVGLYADYYFSSDNAALLLPTQFVQGWAARTTAGVSYNVAGGTKILVGGEVGGLGSQNFTTWSVRGRASVPF